MDSRDPSPAISNRWQELLDDSDATAAEYEADGWETLLIHTGEVTPVTGDPFGLDVLAPGDDFDELESLVEGTTFDTSHVYRAEEGGVRFLLIVVEATARETAVIVPAYLDLADADRLQERASDAGRMYTHVRPLSDDARVTFSHEDPSLFF